MKKVLFVAVVAVFAFASCKKKSTCKYPLLPKAEYDHSEYTDAELEALKQGCEMSGGTWSSK